VGKSISPIQAKNADNGVKKNAFTFYGTSQRSHWRQVAKLVCCEDFENLPILFKFSLCCILFAVH